MQDRGLVVRADFLWWSVAVSVIISMGSDQRIHTDPVRAGKADKKVHVVGEAKGGAGMCTQVGGDMKARAGKKPVVLELGGNAAALVEDFRGDDELDAIVGKITFGAFYQSGQSCISLQRLMVRQVRGVPSCLTDYLCMSFINILVSTFQFGISRRMHLFFGLFWCAFPEEVTG